MHLLKHRFMRTVVMLALVVAFAFSATPAIAGVGPGAPVYRFYNNDNGTHFYTASAEEMQDVQAKWPDIFVYEGISFYVTGMVADTGASMNYPSVPLYRFYNTKSKSHFYTTSPDEVASVKAKYPTTFLYEGAAFQVYTSNEYGDFAPVYRFYNMVNGSHFYTISLEEKVLVQSLWSNVYRYEGIAFYARPPFLLR